MNDYKETEDLYIVTFKGYPMDSLQFLIYFENHIRELGKKAHFRMIVDQLLKIKKDFKIEPLTKKQICNLSVIFSLQSMGFSDKEIFKIMKIGEK